MIIKDFHFKKYQGKWYYPMGGVPPSSPTTAQIRGVLKNRHLYAGWDHNGNNGK